MAIALLHVIMLHRRHHHVIMLRHHPIGMEGITIGGGGK
jgi:hypothetical protein